jgi:hypothetical protein
MINYNELMIDQLISDFFRCGYIYFDNRKTFGNIVIADHLTLMPVGRLETRNKVLKYSYVDTEEVEDECYRYFIENALIIPVTRNIAVEPSLPPAPPHPAEEF